MLKRYMICFEADCFGEIYGFTDDIDSAKELMDNVFNQKEKILFPEVSVADHKTTLVSYTYHKSCEFLLYNCPLASCNGVVSVYVYDTAIPSSFTIEQFVFERRNTIYLFDVVDVSFYDSGFVTEPLSFLAN